VAKIRFNENVPTITGILHEDRYTVLITFRSVLLRMREFAHSNCREIGNIQFVFNNFFSKIVLFVRKCGEVW